MKKVAVFKIWMFLTILLAFSGGGCSSLSNKNNYLHPQDFVRHLDKNGVPVSEIKPLDPAPLNASEALGLTVAGSQIGVYKYDINDASKRKRLNMIEKSKRVFFVGFPYPVYEVSGSFIVVGLDKNKEKKRILEALRTFR